MILFHGSNIQGLKKLNKGTYATLEYGFAMYFINNQGGDLVASIGRLNKMPYICERKRGVINKNYKNKSGSIYLVDKKYFNKGTIWKEEWISTKSFQIWEEIKINNVKKELEKLEKKKKLKIIYYKDRLKYFPNIDKELVKVCLDIIKKCGKDEILFNIKKYQPQILDKVLKVAKNSSSTK